MERLLSHFDQYSCSRLLPIILDVDPKIQETEVPVNRDIRQQLGIGNLFCVILKQKFWKYATAEEQYQIKIKITKSADYTVLYLDVFNYKKSDFKYIFLSCPFITFLSGEGNYLRPFYVNQCDQFLVSLFFTINQNDSLQENRNKILDNLVPLR